MSTGFLHGAGLAQALDGLDEGRPAIDHAGGIARLMGDEALFARVLVRFRQDYRDAAARIRAALDGGDTVLALRLAHTLKGAAGMLEALPLRDAAQALELALCGSGGDPRSRLALLERALGLLLRELEAAPPPAKSRASSAPPGAHRDAPERLAALLDAGDGDAVELVREAEAALRASMEDRAYDELAEAIESFDFDGALAMLAARRR